MVMLPSLLYSAAQKQAQFDATAHAYKQGGVKVERAIEVEQLKQIAAQDAPPMLLIAGGCPYTLIEQIRNTDSQKAIREIARKSMVAGACAGAMAISSGSHIAARFNETTGNYDQVDRSKVDGLRGVEMVRAQVLPISDKLGSFQPRAIAKAYLGENPFTPIYMLDGGSGFYCQSQPGKQDSIEPLGKTEILIASAEAMRKVCPHGYNVLEVGEKPLIADISYGMV